VRAAAVALISQLPESSQPLPTVAVAVVTLVALALWQSDALDTQLRRHGAGDQERSTAPRRDDCALGRRWRRRHATRWRPHARREPRACRSVLPPGVPVGGTHSDPRARQAHRLGHRVRTPRHGGDSACECPAATAATLAARMRWEEWEEVWHRHQPRHKPDSCGGGSFSRRYCKRTTRQRKAWRRRRRE
jgi:hypothetical protein